jgi:hypothetical protein
MATRQKKPRATSSLSLRPVTLILLSRQTCRKTNSIVGPCQTVAPSSSKDAAEVRDDLGRYMVERGVAHRHRMLRKVRQLFDRFGKPLEEVFESEFP